MTDLTKEEQAFFVGYKYWDETHKKLERLADALVDNIIETSDEDILAEVEEDHGDRYHDAKVARKIINEVQDEGS